MKNFYEMMRIVEAEGDEEGVNPQDSQAVPPADAPEMGPPAGDAPKGDGMERKHYMFFSNLKAIKGMAEDILAMDAAKVDSMLGDGHDWASDHMSTSRDDIEEVYNWLSGNMGEEA